MIYEAYDVIRQYLKRSCLACLHRIDTDTHTNGVRRLVAGFLPPVLHRTPNVDIKHKRGTESKSHRVDSMSSPRHVSICWLQPTSVLSAIIFLMIIIQCTQAAVNPTQVRKPPVRPAFNFLWETFGTNHTRGWHGTLARAQQHINSLAAQLRLPSPLELGNLRQSQFCSQAVTVTNRRIYKTFYDLK